MQVPWCSLALVVFTLVSRKVSATGIEQQYCTDLKPQNSLDLTQIMGMWYGVEIIPHLREEDWTINYDSCVIIHLSDTSYEMATTDGYVRPGGFGYNWNQGSYGSSYGSSGMSSMDSGHDFRDREYRYLRLYWEEASNNMEYSLKFNTTRRGFWINSGPQNGQEGTIFPRQYNQFVGVVQVMKAVGDHLVLTFCSRLPESKLFTVILSRDPQQLGRQVVHSIHNLLNRRDLSTSAARKVCRNAAPSVDASVGSLFAFTLISIFVYFGAGRI